MYSVEILELVAGLKANILEACGKEAWCDAVDNAVIELAAVGIENESEAYKLLGV